MKAEIISIIKDEEDIVLQVRCSPPSELSSTDWVPPPERLEEMGKTFHTYLEEDLERVEKRDKEISKYKQQMSRFKLGFIEIGNKEE